MKDDKLKDVNSSVRGDLAVAYVRMRKTSSIAIYQEALALDQLTAGNEMSEGGVEPIASGQKWLNDLTVADTAIGSAITIRDAKLRKDIHFDVRISAEMRTSSRCSSYLLHEPSTVVEPLPGRRMALILPLLPPPQKN